MCGIAGVWDTAGDVDIHKCIESMVSTLQHRGPDGQRLWFSEDGGIALGHRRLSIIDLNPTGNQPMRSENGRYVISFNGEIYNYKELKADLERHAQAEGESICFQGTSDTEVLLKCFERFGISASLEMATGMFAIALYDTEECTLYLVRDRVGEKPLHYGVFGRQLYFSSELKSFYALDAFPRQVDYEAIDIFFRHNYIPAPYTAIKGVRKVMPGHYLKVSSDEGRFEVDEICYWKRNAHQDNRFKGMNEKDIIEAFHARIMKAVTMQMLSADVRVGAFLSGGIDSSLIVALMQSQAKNPVKTYSIGFDSQEYNEAHYAKAVAKHLGTDHTEYYVSSNEAQSIARGISAIYDEPFSDASQIPTYLVSQLAQRDVTVALSGDAGDELLYGYSRYEYTKRWHQKTQQIPMKLAMNTLAAFPTSAIDRLYQAGRVFLPREYQGIKRPGYRIKNLAKKATTSGGYRSMYFDMITHWKEDDAILSDPTRCKFMEERARSLDDGNIDEFMMGFDFETYLPDDILVKVDRAAMATSLETRVPFLDKDVVEFAQALPLGYKLREGKAKWISRQILKEYVPTSLYERPKMGFGVPIHEWLRTDMKKWASELLDPNQIRKDGILNADIICRKWEEHQSGRMDWSYLLWDVIVFQQWYHRFF